MDGEVRFIRIGVEKVKARLGERHSRSSGSLRYFQDKILQRMFVWGS